MARNPTRAGGPGRTAPGPGGVAAGRVLLSLMRDPLAAATSLVRRYGDAVRVPVLPGRDLVVLTHPDHAEHVLAAAQDNYVKAVTYAPLREFLGLGLVTSDGPLWERQRRLVQPLFSHRRVIAFVPVMVARTQALLDEWDDLPDGALVDVAEDMSRLTLDMLGETLFGADLRRVGPDVARSVAVMQEFSVRAMHNPLLLTAPRTGLRTTPGYRRWQGAVGTIDDVIADLVARRRATPGLPRPGTPPEARDRGDLLETLLTARGEDGAGIGDRQIRDEIVTFLLAGHETSATALDWALLLLSADPAARRRLEDEVDDVLGGRAPDADDVAKLTWTKAVVSEALRLYPPFWTLERDALEDDVVAGVRVPAGSTVAVPPYLVHRHPAAWDNPEGFDPSRFLPENGAGRHRYAWIPFAGGRRGCVGNVFALTETVVALALVTQRFRLDLAPGARPEPQGAVTLRPRGGLRMVLRRRRT